MVALTIKSGSRVLSKWYCTEGLFCGENNVSPYHDFSDMTKAHKEVFMHDNKVQYTVSKTRKVIQERPSPVRQPVDMC